MFANENTSLNDHVACMHYLANQLQNKFWLNISFIVQKEQSEKI